MQNGGLSKMGVGGVVDFFFNFKEGQFFFFNTTFSNMLLYIFCNVSHHDVEGGGSDLSAETLKGGGKIYSRVGDPEKRAYFMRNKNPTVIWILNDQNSSKWPLEEG